MFINREEIIEYYEKLTEEAAIREQRALWHVRRLKLQEDRTNFIQNDDEYWESEFKKTDKPVVS